MIWMSENCCVNDKILANEKATMILIALTVFLQKAKADWPIGKGRTTLLPGPHLLLFCIQLTEAGKEQLFPAAIIFKHMLQTCR